METKKETQIPFISGKEIPSSDGHFLIKITGAKTLEREDGERLFILEYMCIADWDKDKNMYERWTDPDPKPSEDSWETFIYKPREKTLEHNPSTVGGWCIDVNGTLVTLTKEIVLESYLVAFAPAEQELIREYLGIEKTKIKEPPLARDITTVHHETRERLAVADSTDGFPPPRQ